MKYHGRLAVAGSAILATICFSGTSFAMNWNGETLPQAGDEQIFASTSDTTSLAFICVQGKLRAAIATQGEAPEDVLSTYQDTRRRIQRDVTMSIDGEVVSDSRWMINAMHKVYSTPSRSEASKLYNAAIQQKPVKVQRKGKDPVVLNLPAPNQTFAEFGASCGVGNKSKKQS